MKLTGEKVRLRSLEIDDLDFLYEVENDETFWELSSTFAPFSKDILRAYIKNAKQDIAEAGQYRFVIANIENDTPLGFIDLFDFDGQHSRAGIGIIIHPKFQNLGFGKDALEVLVNYSNNTLNLHQIYANVLEGNDPSLRLFKGCHFEIIGTKKDWISYQGSYKNEIILQRILES